MSGLDWLLSFSDPVRGVGWNRASRGGLEWNLRRTRLLLDVAGSPDRTMHVVLVAGTKGKGSTAAMLASLLAASGVRAGLSTKPHLQSYRERVRVQGIAIDGAALEREAAEMRTLVEALAGRSREAGAPTTFELTTVLALRHYARAHCEVAILEVGLGGRYDATNATDPTVSVITAISHDHTRELGTRLRDIAREKAGIVRPGRVAIVAPQPPEAREAIRDAIARDAAIAREVRSVTFDVGLAGLPQRANAAAAIAAAEALASHGPAYHADVARSALARLRWPGRFEVVEGRIVLDGAHNDGSAAALAAALRREFPRRRVRFVLGLMEDKDATRILRPLLPLASAVEVTRSRSPRALAPAILARRIRGVPVRVHDDVAGALSLARRDATNREVLCVTGSLALVGEAREALGLPVAERLWD